MKKNRIDVITLGCSKNLVDSERLLKRFEDCGYEVYTAIANTGGFSADELKNGVIIRRGKKNYNKIILK